MRRVTGVAVIAVSLLAATLAWAGSCFEVMEDVQEKVTWQVWNANGWAASPIVVEAVLAQNGKGPIAGMENEKWKSLGAGDPIVQGFLNNDAGQFLKSELAKTEGVCLGAYLMGAKGEAVAFTAKPGSYIQKGSAGFEASFGTGKVWQGKPELTKQIYVIQVAVPVLAEGKPIGAILVEVNGSKLEEAAKK